MPAEGAASMTVRIGLLRLTDAAPVVLAAARGLFAAEGVKVELVVEPSWANLADRLSYGFLDAAVILPPLVLAMALGLRPPQTRLLVPMSLSLSGNSVTLANALAAPILEGGRPAPQEAGRLLRRLLADGRKPVFAVVHAWSTHDLLLRYWLAASGIDPEREIEWAVVPPAAMTEALATGRIDGFCAGAPWGAVAAAAGIGRTILVSSGIWRDHPEKCFAVGTAWAERHPAALQAVLRALLRAAALCDDPAETPALAELLAQPAFVNVPAAAIAASLAGGKAEEVDRSRFAPHEATFPRLAHARWFLGQMARWRELPAGLDAAKFAAGIYRPDLYCDAARAIGLPAPDLAKSGRSAFYDGTSFDG